MDQLFTRVKAIRRDSDRPDPAAGLCMLIDPHDRDSLLIPETAILYIPTNQDMGFSIPSAVD